LELIARTLFDLAKLNAGEPGVLDAAAEGEHNLEKDYDKTIEATSDQETASVLKRQREEVKSGKETLREMSDTQKDAGPEGDAG
jgi:hypothetical protein